MPSRRAQTKHACRNVTVLQAYQAQILMAAGDPSTKAAPVWRAVRLPTTKAS